MEVGLTSGDWAMEEIHIQSISIDFNLLHEPGDRIDIDMFSGILCDFSANWSDSRIVNSSDKARFGP